MKLAAGIAILMAASGAAFSDPGATTTRLMNEPVSMLTYGNRRLAEAVADYLKTALPGTSTWANVLYDWDTDRINIHTAMYVETAAGATKSSCKDLIVAVKTQLGIDPTTGAPAKYPNYEPTASAAADFYDQNGYTSKGKPKDFPAQIDKIILIHGLVQDTKDFSVPVAKCESPLLSSDVMYAE